jgi:hypothetical protein
LIITKEITMAANVGTVDRALRLIVGAALIVAPLLNFMGLGASTAVAYTLMGVGGILALTAVFGMCPIYSLLGIKTNS